MDQIAQFQHWIGAPVVAFATEFWWLLAFFAFAIVAYFFFPGARSSDGATFSLGLGDDSGDGGDGGGDGGGGD